jgi:Ca-activated chloride channel family protein
VLSALLNFVSCSRGVAAVVALMICLSAAPACAQAESQSEDAVHIVPRGKTAVSASEPAPTPHTRPLRSDVDVVLVPVTVTDAMNRPVLGLGREHFQLYEGGQPQRIRYFSTEDAPISMGILLDLSKSMRNKIDTAREALGEFFRTSNPADDYFVITFADRPQVVADAGQSLGTIQGKLAQAKPAGHTALLDAIYLGLSQARHARHHRRALLIISDGGDNRSRYTSGEIKSLVQESDVEIYAIGIFDRVFKTPEEWAGKRLLTDITGATGGRLVSVGNVRQLPEVARALSLELRSQYVLGYQPSNLARDGQWRKIMVRLSPSRSLRQAQIYAKRGYRAPRN